MLLNMKQVAEMLGTNVNYVYDLVKYGLLQSIVVGSRKVRVETLEAFLADYDGQNINEIIKERKGRTNEEHV